MKDTQHLDAVTMDLDGLEIEDIEIYLQEGSRGLPEFAASTGSCKACCTNSCSTGGGGGGGQ